LRHLSSETSHPASPYPFLARSLNALPPLRLDPRRETPVAISWVSAYLRGAVTVPRGLNAVLERTIYPATNRDAEFASVQRRESETPQVAFFGRLTPEKGSAVLVQAIARVSDSNDAVELVIAGDGSRSDVARLRSLADSLGIGQRCRFVGPLDTDGMCALLATATVVAVPSTWQEPFGLVLVEAALAGVPVVATRVGGIPEIFSDDEILLVAPSDKHELAQAISRTFAHPEERRERARRARARARTLMWQRYADATCSFVDDAYRTLDALRRGPRSTQ
jgi:glycosyltransferase involved in cell wall biosynthesis